MKKPDFFFKVENIVKNIYISVKVIYIFIVAFVKYITANIKISFEVYHYLFVYYQNLIALNIALKLMDSSFLREVKSFLIAFVLAFFFYYFVVIELSILLFGYSLLCYWFLFVFVFVCYVLAWRLEVEFLKYELSESEAWNTSLNQWASYYNPKTPYSFYDYLTFYKKKPLFKYAIIDTNIEDIEEGWVTAYSFLFFLAILSFYICSYWFDPQFIHFIAQFFHPNTNFFETWWDARWDDYLLSILWFWNWWVAFFSYVYEGDEFVQAILWKIPKASPKWEFWADWKREYKTSLRKTSTFGDIFFLWVLWQYYPLRWMVFEMEQPVINNEKFDWNWYLLFAWYIWGEFDTSKNSFWVKYFKEDPWMWGFLNNIKHIIKDWVQLVEKYNDVSYLEDNVIVPTYFDSLLSENYFDKNFSITEKKYLDYGSQWEMYENILNPWCIKQNPQHSSLFYVFTNWIVTPYPLTISGLWSHWKKTKTSNPILNWLSKRLQNIIIKQRIFRSYDFDSSTAKNMWLSDLSIPMWTYSQTNLWFEEQYNIIDNIALSKSDTTEELRKFLRVLDWRLTILEEKAGLSPMSFSYKDYNWINFNHLLTVMWRWLLWIDVYCNNNNWNLFYLFYNYLPTFYELKKFSSRFSNYFVYDYWPTDPLMQKIYDKFHVKKVEPTIVEDTFTSPTRSHLKTLKWLEIYINNFESWFGFRSNNIFYPTEPSPLKHSSSSKKFNLFEQEIWPWYVWSLQYFSSWDNWLVFPGFVRYYFPTPYPSAFSTFGVKWFQYQLYRTSVTSFHVSESNSLVTDWSSTPMIMYTGVEAIMYFKPVLKFFDFLTNLFIKYITYPIEFFITKFTFIINNLYSLIFFVHLTWFLHFYIYFFLFLYVFYYFAKYYYYKVGFMWFHEWTLENSFLHQTNTFTYWHTLNDIWINYRTPEQFAILSIQTSLLSHYTFFNFKNFVVFTHYGFKNFLQYFSVLYTESNEVVKYFELYQDSTVFLKQMLLLDNFKFFKYYFNINIKKINALLYSGGSDCNFETLAWNYYDYLAQTSIFLSWSLTKKFFVYYNPYFLSLIKQLTILFSSFNISSNFFFLSMPVLDTELSWKLFSELYFYLTDLFLQNWSEFIKNFLYSNVNDKDIFEQGLFLELWLNFFNFFYKSGLDVYRLFNYKELNDMSKVKTGNFWDSPKYWIFAFFWSFWFVSRLNYPHLNISKNHEVNWLQLRWVAYSNSWIGSSVFIWPSFNLLQHLWWTSWTYNWAFLLTDPIQNLNNNPKDSLDNVWNFFEKWYTFENLTRWETIFGLVWSLSFRTKKIVKWYWYEDPFDNPHLNHDLTYDMLFNQNITTERKFEKTNPPLDVMELGITPSSLLSIFEQLPSSYSFIYLSFFEQLDLITNSKTWDFSWNLKLDYWYWPGFSIWLKNKHPWWLSQFDFYLKRFEWQYKNKNELKNWIFSFDINFFLNHFLTWDYFTSDNFSFSWSNRKFFIENKNKKPIIQSKMFYEIHPLITSTDHWFMKPFGVLDWMELFGFEWYKNIKLLDELSYTFSWEDVFISNEKESIQSSIGYSYTGLSDLWTSWDTYSESFIGEWFLRAPFNLPLLKNIPGPIILGWVGELLTTTVDSTSMLFSTLYAKSELSPVVSVEKFEPETYLTWTNYNDFFIDSFFLNSSLKLKLFSRITSWINLSLYPTSYWYFFGMKSLSWLDYWSWKCGLYVDYWNGFYNYRPYLGFRHTYGSKLTVFDSLYGFYWSYWQVDDDPTIVDLETDAVEQLFEEKNDNIFEEEDEWNKLVFNLEDEDHWWILRNLSLPFWEVYYSFHHPYFIGYFIFWFFCLLLSDCYLGLSNFSLRWLIIRWFFQLNEIYTNLDFNSISISRTSYENKYRWAMSRYWMYWINPIKLSNNFDNLYDEETLLMNEWSDYLVSSFNSLYFLFSFFFKNMEFSTPKFNTFFDFKKIPLQLLNINWYNFDLPFCLNPYIVLNSTFTNLSTSVDYNQIYHNYYLSYSHFDTLWETLNLSLMFDWSHGSYIDILNFSSYYSTYWSQTSLPSYVFDAPHYVATNHLWFSFDKSYQLASEEYKQFHFYSYTDISLGDGLLLNNLSFLRFFLTSLSFLFKLSSSYYSYGFSSYSFFLKFLDIYVKESNFADDLQKLWWFTVWTSETPVLTVSNYLDSPLSGLKHLLFLFRIQRNLPHDILLVWLQTGVYFFDWSNLNKFLKLKKFYLTKWFKDLEKFYSWIGFQIFYFFIKK